MKMKMSGISGPTLKTSENSCDSNESKNYLAQKPNSIHI